MCEPVVNCVARTRLRMPQLTVRPVLFCDVVEISNGSLLDLAQRSKDASHLLYDDCDGAGGLRRIRRFRVHLKHGIHFSVQLIFGAELMNGGDAAKQRSPDGIAKRSDEPQKLMFHAAKLQASRNFQNAFRLCAQSVLFLVSISFESRV